MVDLALEPAPIPRARRYPLELPVELGSLRGLTRDISVTGVRFECGGPAAALRVGDGLRIVLLFPSAVYGRAYRLLVEGRVVRVESTAAGATIALSTHELRFGEPSDSAGG